MLSHQSLHPRLCHTITAPRQGEGKHRNTCDTDKAASVRYLLQTSRIYQLYIIYILNFTLPTINIDNAKSATQEWLPQAHGQRIEAWTNVLSN